MSASDLSALILKLDSALPQTQCGQCGFEGCMPYAISMAENKSKINRCPPGGLPVLKNLAQILKTKIIPLDENCGQHLSPVVMRIDESLCIGCTKCIQACPVDAIIGTKKWMHTIIQAECTGCALCIPACPLDCILTLPIQNNAPNTTIGLSAFQTERAQTSRRRFNLRKKRYQSQKRLTETVLPQNIVLAERKDPSSMLDLINMAKNKAKQKH